MSLLVDLQLVPQRILEKVRAAVLQNREALRHGGIRSRVNQATKQRPQFTKVGATMRDYKAPVPVATGDVYGRLNLGWHEKLPFVQAGSTTPPSYKVISGDGSTSHDVTWPSYPVINAPPSVEVTWEGGSTWPDWEWDPWAYIPVMGGYPGAWYRQRSASGLKITLARGWGPSIYRNRLVLPHDNGLIYADFYKSDQLYRWHTYSIGTTYVYQYMRGGPSDNPVALEQNPDNVYWQFESSIGPVTVTSGPNDTYHQHNIINTVSIGRDWVKPVEAPVALSEVFNKLSALDMQTRTFEPDWTFTGSSSIYWQPLSPATIDGTLYSKLWVRQVRVDPSWNQVNQWPVVQIPVYDYDSSNVDQTAIDLQNYLGTSGLGLAWLRPESGAGGAFGYTLPYTQAGTPYIYRALLGDVPAEFESQSGRDLMDVLETMAPTPRQFSIVQALAATEPSLYVTTETQLEFPTYAATAVNFPPGTTPSQLVSGDFPVSPGRPPRYRWTMAPQGQRVVTTSDAEVVPLFGAAFGAGSECRQQLLELGFTDADLAPPPPTP